MINLQINVNLTTMDLNVTFCEVYFIFAELITARRLYYGVNKLTKSGSKILNNHDFIKEGSLDHMYKI